MNPAVNDVRIKMCIKPTEEELFTVYHELGHVYYYLSYSKLPNLFRSGAHDGFHEAIGDTVNLSVTPGYLAKIGLINAVKPSPEAVINQQMKMALDKIAFLPFGRLIDQWRWKVSGEMRRSITEAWWDCASNAVSLPRSRAPPTSSRRLRAGKRVTRATSCYHPVPVPRAVRGGGVQGPLSECRSTVTRSRAAVRRSREGRKCAVAGRALPTHRNARDGCPAILYLPASDHAQGTEQGQKCGW
jgi:hypothetical protein